MLSNLDHACREIRQGRSEFIDKCGNLVEVKVFYFFFIYWESFFSSCWLCLATSPRTNSVHVKITETVILKINKMLFSRLFSWALFILSIWKTVRTARTLMLIVNYTTACMGTIVIKNLRRFNYIPSTLYLHHSHDKLFLFRFFILQMT